MRAEPFKNRVRELIALSAVIAVGSCGATTVLAPVGPDEVSITLAVTGGLAGTDYAFRVDGATGEVRGVRCVTLCDFSAGDVLAFVSEAQVAHLVDRLDRAGTIALDGTDFGQGCCDFNGIDLLYERGEHAARITGTEDRLPAALAEAVRILAPLVRGTLPAIVAPGTMETDWPRDPYTLGEVTVDGSILLAEVTYGGGCEGHAMDLVFWGGWLESFPVQIDALITHDDGDDPCDGLITEERAFDLYTLGRAYAEAYGEPDGEPARVIIRLRDPVAGGPMRSIEVQL